MDMTSDKNFLHPIRKETDNLNINELHFNSKFGSFQSEIENQFSILASKFDKFNNNRSAIQLSYIKYYNLQFKIACILKNIWQLVKDYEVEIQPHHMFWYNNNFSFPTKKLKLDFVFTNEYIKDKNINDIVDIQEQILKLSVSDINNMNIDIEDNNEEDIDMDTNHNLVHKKKKTNNNKYYEIEQIIDYKEENKIYLYLVKWKGYSNRLASPR